MISIKLISPSGVLYRHKHGIFPRVLRYAPSTLTMLAALIPDDIEHQVSIVDEGIDTLNIGDDPDIVAISIITGTAERGYAIADYYRSRGSHVVIGGVHATLMPQEALQHADSIVTGLAYLTWPQLLRDYCKGKTKSWYQEVKTKELPPIPLARFDLLKKFSYITKASTQASYGCPFKCDFCAVATTQFAYRHRPIADVVRDIERMPGKTVAFVDPSPIEDKRYIKELWKALIPLKIKWGGLATVRIAKDPELLELAEKSGCKGLLIGFETISETGTKLINKPFNRVNDYKEVIDKCHDHGIAINGTFMFGLDSDDSDTFKRTVEFVYEAAVDLPRFAIYTPFPGTPVYQRFKKEGRLLTDRWSLYDAQHVVFQPKQLSCKELYDGNLYAWNETYKLSNILSRIKRSGCTPMLSIATNLGYRHYSNKMQKYDESSTLETLQKWNAELVDYTTEHKQVLI